MKYSVTFHPSLARTLVEIYQKGISTRHSNLVDLIEKTFWNLSGTEDYRFEVESPLDSTEIETEIVSDLVEYAIKSGERSGGSGLKYLFTQKLCYDLENLGIDVQVQ